MMKKQVSVIGIISLVLGILLFIVCWIPYIGCFGVPVAAVGIILGVISAMNKKNKLAMPLAGIILSACSIFIACTTFYMAEKAKETLEKTLGRPGQPNMQQLKEKLLEAARPLMERLEYIRVNMEIYDIEAKYFTDEAGKRYAGVTFNIKNDGSRVLSGVKVSGYFMNSEGEEIHGVDLFPVNTQAATNPTEPLEPNSIWQMGKGKFMEVKSVPEDWKEGEVDLVITNIQFLK